MRGSGPCGARRLVTAPSMAGGKGCRPGRGAWLMTISMVLSDIKQCKRGKRVGAWFGDEFFGFNETCRSNGLRLKVN